MTDETTELPVGETPAEETAADAAPATATAVVEHAAAPEPVSFWHRPNVERYLLPLITPILVVLGILIWVLNMSRIFLSAHGHIPVVVGSIITVVILVGATLISNSRHMRSQSAILMTAGFVLIAVTAGWLVLGHSEVKTAGGAALPAQGPCVGQHRHHRAAEHQVHAGQCPGEDRYLLHHAHRSVDLAHARFRRPCHVVPRGRGLDRRREGVGSDLLRRRGRLHVLLRDSRPPGRR